MLNTLLSKWQALRKKATVIIYNIISIGVQEDERLSMHRGEFVIAKILVQFDISIAEQENR